MCIKKSWIFLCLIAIRKNHWCSFGSIDICNCKEVSQKLQIMVGATRSGIETNPITNGKLYYNGGSSIWSPAGRAFSSGP